MSKTFAGLCSSIPSGIKAHPYIDVAGSITMLMLCIPMTLTMSTILAGASGFIIATIIILTMAYLGIEKSSKSFTDSTDIREIDIADSPWLHSAAKDICGRLDKNMPPPRLFVKSGQSLSAFTSGRGWRDAVIVFTDRLLSDLTHDETCAVMAHEICHIFHYENCFKILHVLWAGYLIFTMLVLGMRFIPAILLGLVSALVYQIAVCAILAILRKNEYRADRTAARVIGSPEHLATGLQKIGKDDKGSSLFCEVMCATHPPLNKRLARLAALTT